MYIADKYWNHYIGDTDDSFTLTAYLADKHKEEISLEEIFSDIGLDKLNGDFRQHEEPLTVVLKNEESDYEEPYVEFYYAIDLIMDLAALLLECKVNGSVNLCELSGEDLETPTPDVRIIATSEEHELINKILMDFVSAPLSYDLSEMCQEEEMQETAEVCEKLRKELFG
ncbi:MAG: hypothetical protein J6C19_05240 [Lachnospiraceae bacterium]|nr:hypothetical protein [Lachnospiraceae bacterium]MBO5144922.1 hypothetical protein [Lachnospiraceae bacterium]